MKRQVSKEKSIHAFKIDIDELGGLITQLIEEFGGEEKPWVSIELNFGREGKYEFKHVEELQHSDLPYKSCRKFTIHIGGHGQSFWLKATGGSIVLGTIGANISATGFRKTWCAEIIEVAETYLKNHRTWHYWLSGYGMFIAISLTAISTLIYLHKLTAIDMPSPFEVFSWFGVVLFFILIWEAIRDKLFPVGVIILTGKKNHEEKILKWTVITAMATLLLLFINPIKSLISKLAGLLHF